MARDADFSAETKKKLAERVGYVCSNPQCKAPTSGPGFEDRKSVSVGEAAHITAASQNGPRYDSSLTLEERLDIGNGIWLCANCARKIDRDKTQYTVQLLRQWRRQAEAEAMEGIGKPKKGAQNINAAVVIQGANAIRISGPNAVVLGPNAIRINGPIIKKD